MNSGFQINNVRIAILEVILKVI